VINLEMETDFKQRHIHIMKLNNQESNQEIENQNGYVDENGTYHPVDQDEKLFKENEKLMQRLTVAASKNTLKSNNMDQTSQWDHTRTSEAILDITSKASKQAQVQEMVQNTVNDDGEGTIEKSVIHRSGPSEVKALLDVQAAGTKIAHEEWVRRKDHENKLRQKLIIEAKRDLLETLVQKQEEEALRMQERSHHMYEWENRKVMQIQHKKLVEL